MATYSHNANDLTPLMTANNAPSPNVVSASEENTPDNLAFRAFDHSATDFAWQTSALTTGWLKFNFGSGNEKTVVKYTVSIPDNFFGDLTICPKTWTFQGSNNDSDWTTLDTQTNVAAWSNAEMRTYEFSNTTAYRYYKIDVTANQGGSVLVIAEIEMMPAEAASNDIVDGADFSDTWSAVVLHGQLIGNAGISDIYILDTPYRDIASSAGMADFYEIDTPDRSITEDMGINVSLAQFIETMVEILDGIGMTDTYARYIEVFRSIQDNTCTADGFAIIRRINKTMADILFSWDTIKWGWRKTIADFLAITEIVEKILGIPVKEWLTIVDTETNNWNGVESLLDSFYTIDIPKVIRVYKDLLADGMAIADAVKIALGLIITDILTCTDTVLNTGTFQYFVEDGMTLEDIARKFFPKSISDSFTASDFSLADFLALLQVSDSLDATDTAIGLVTINKIIADSLEALDTVTIQHLIQELIQDGLNINVSVIIDGEVYECWVLNTSDFHPSVYSNYEFNSFAIDKQTSTVYGCRSDGIYRLDGETDNGTAFKAGIVLPDTQFGSPHNKRFHKAFLGVDGNNLALRAETESGSKTFAITDTEISITRDLKGRSWKFSVEDFDSLDFIELLPVILSRK